MRIKLDENLPISLADKLRALGHEADTVADEGLLSQPDDVIWQAAQSEGRFLITQDLDFSDARRFVPGTHAGILLVRLRVPGIRALEERVLGLFQAEGVAGWSGRIVIATDLKLRLR